MSAPPPPVDLATLLSVADFARAAEGALAPLVHAYYAGGADDEVTLREAPAAWEAMRLRYRVLRGSGERRSDVTLLGQAHAFPARVAPTAFQRMAHPDGELAVTRAANACGIGMTISTIASTSIEDICGAAAQAPWFQLYIARDRGEARAVVERAEAAGCGALLLTVDAPPLGRRERDLRQGFRLPPDLPVPNVVGRPREGLSAAAPHASALGAFFDDHLEQQLGWRDVEWLKGITRLPLLVKGVVRGDDAVRALAHGADGVVVSNHGGRQLDTAVATARALPEVAEAMDGRGTLLVDGGIRRGTDIVKALALGAQGVLLGRPVLWGLAAGGEAGVTRVLRLLHDEFALATRLCGALDPSELTRDLVVVPS